MVAPYHLQKGLTLYEGEASATLSEFRKNSVDCIVTSPPYFRLRDYGHSDQVGQEDSWSDYCNAIGSIFEEALRVLRPHGTCWLNIGDKWEKNELMPAYDVMTALRQSGWLLAQTFIWHKTNVTPYGAKRRQTQDHEYVFLLAKNADYDYDRRAVMVPAKWERWGKQTIVKEYRGIKPIDMNSLDRRRQEGKPVRTVWSMPTKPYRGRHDAAFPPALAERCMRLGCKPKGIVLDPFIGSGSTAAAAKTSGRRCIGIDLRSDFLDDTIDRWTGAVAA
jgi:DNA modification methylase